MSGGIAYVYDPERTFTDRFNPDMVDAEPLDHDDRVWVGEMIERHLEETGSMLAVRLLASWASTVSDMVKVMPVTTARARRHPAANEAGTSSKRRSWRCLVGEPTGFMKYGRQLPRRRPVRVRLRDWRESTSPSPKKRCASRARVAWTAASPSATRLPAWQPDPEWNDLVYRDDFSDAIERLHATTTSPSSPAVCAPRPARCLRARHQCGARHHRADRVRDRERAFAEGWVKPQLPRERTGRRVAVVGSGPAGLACAQQLTRAGHDVVVFERAERPGGSCATGSPSSRWKRRCSTAASPVARRRGGVPLRHAVGMADHALADLEPGDERGAGTASAPDVTLLSAAAIHDEFDAMVLAGGATKPRDLTVPGRQLDGIHVALDYLKPANMVQEGTLGAH